MKTFKIKTFHVNYDCRNDVRDYCLVFDMANHRVPT